MQREIKFRGKRVDTGEWVYGYYIRYEHMGVVKHIIVTDYAQVYVNSFYVIPETVGQYTGLKDKNDKEIYIGDIVNCLEVSDTRSKEYISEVFEEECEVLVHDSRMSDTSLTIFFPRPNQIPLTLIEVLGNVFDNPELLQEVEK